MFLFVADLFKLFILQKSLINTTFLTISLHWLSVHFRILLKKFLLFVFKSLNGLNTSDVLRNFLWVWSEHIRQRTTPIFRDYFGVWPECFSILQCIIKPTSKDTHQAFAVHFKTSQPNLPEKQNEGAWIPKASTPECHSQRAMRPGEADQEEWSARTETECCSVIELLCRFHNKHRKGVNVALRHRRLHRAVVPLWLVSFVMCLISEPDGGDKSQKECSWAWSACRTLEIADRYWQANWRVALAITEANNWMKSWKKTFGLPWSNSSKFSAIMKYEGQRIYWWIL